MSDKDDADWALKVPNGVKPDAKRPILNVHRFTFQMSIYNGVKYK